MNANSKPTAIEAKAAPTSKAKRAPAHNPVTNAKNLVSRYCGSTLERTSGPTVADSRRYLILQARG